MPLLHRAGRLKVDLLDFGLGKTPGRGGGLLAGDFARPDSSLRLGTLRPLQVRGGWGGRGAGYSCCDCDNAQGAMLQRCEDGVVLAVSIE